MARQRNGFTGCEVPGRHEGPVLKVLESPLERARRSTHSNLGKIFVEKEMDPFGFFRLFVCSFVFLTPNNVVPTPIPQHSDTSWASSPLGQF